MFQPLSYNLFWNNTSNDPTFKHPPSAAQKVIATEIIRFVC